MAQEIEGRVTSGNRVISVNEIFHDAARLVKWPREPHGWVYLGTAIDRLGAAMFPEWRFYSAYGLLPDVAVGTTYEGVFIEPEAQLHYASWLLTDRKEDAEYIYRMNKPFAYRDHPYDGRSLTDEEWSHACDLSQKEWAVGIGNQRMFREVQERIVEEAESNRITIGSRPERGGEPKPTPRDWWFTDHYGSRFANLTIDPNDPFSEKLPGADVAHQLFVRSDDLSLLLSRCKGGAVAPQEKSEHSPYLRLMLEVADAMGISPSIQPKKESIVHELQARWESYGLPASNNLMNTAASLLREPESQAGRAKK